MNPGIPRLHVRHEVGGRIAAHLGPALVEQHLAGFDVPVPCREVRAVERELDPLLRLVNLGFEPLANRDVSNEGLPAPVAQDLARPLRPGHLCRPCGATTTRRRPHAPPSILLPIRFEPRDVFGTDHIDDRHADELVARVSDDPTARRVDIGIAALRIGDEDPIGCALEQRAEPLVRGLDFLSRTSHIGDVARDRAHAEQRSRSRDRGS